MQMTGSLKKATLHSHKAFMTFNRHSRSLKVKMDKVKF